jgi:hypothetical protein
MNPNSFCKSDNFLGPFLTKFNNLRSGNPFSKESRPFFPKLKVLLFDSSTIAKFFNFSHSIPRLI